LIHLSDDLIKVEEEDAVDVHPVDIMVAFLRIALVDLCKDFATRELLPSTITSVVIDVLDEVIQDSIATVFKDDTSLDLLLVEDKHHERQVEELSSE